MCFNTGSIGFHHFAVLAGIFPFLLPAARVYVSIFVEPKQLRFAIEGGCMGPSNQVRISFCARFEKSENLDVTRLQYQSVLAFMRLVYPEVAIPRRTAEAVAVSLDGQNADHASSEHDFMSFKFIPGLDGAVIVLLLKFIKNRIRNPDFFPDICLRSRAPCEVLDLLG